MSDFEREVVRCLNRFFKTHQIQAFAYRYRELISTGRYMDVRVDSPDPSFHLSIACKSIIDRKLYFSQHFHADRNKVHPVDAISVFLQKTGRTGFLAVEFRQGPGKKGEAFLIPWLVLVNYFRYNKGITIDDARSCIVLAGSKDGYQLDSLNAK